MTEQTRPTYRKINGKLVRLPGDERIPGRRYSTVSGDNPDGVDFYDLEFTEEEERQRDEEEAQWEAEKPQREAEKKRIKEEAEKFRESLQYENRIVAFLDILGWRNAIERSETNSELTRKLGIALNVIQKQVQMAEWTTQHGGEERWPGDPQITHFSDSVVLSVLADSYAPHLLPFYLRSVIINLLNLGFLVRGGIAIGPMIHRGSMAYGPAFIRAYDLESNKDYGKKPRIILDTPLAQAWGQGIRIQSKDGSLIGYQKTWRKDSDDNWSFYDFLQPFPDPVGTSISTQQFSAQLTVTRNLITNGLKEYALKEDAFSKYQWAAQYFNDILDEYPITSLKKIIL